MPYWPRAPAWGSRNQSGSGPCNLNGVTTPEPLPLPDDSWAVDERSLQLFTEQLREAPAERAWHELRREAERIALVPGFDRLITLDANAIKELPHQIDVAQRVLRDMGGRAILADEVGLGKTIEASIIYKELAIRGLARRVLILTPASLVGQWQGELEEKFFEHFDTPNDPDDWHGVTRAIVSHDRARSRRHADEILRHRWDLVIVDEAHKVKSHRGATYQFIEKIERDFILLLTATPLQNDLRELYNLITLLRPGQLGTWQEFKSVHLVAGDHRQPRDPAALRVLTHEVMIRTRRSSVVDDLDLPPRRPRHPEVRLTRAETDLYERTTEFLRKLYREGFIQPAEQEEAEDGALRRRPTKKGILQLAVIHLRQRLCSSSRALAESLEHLAQGERISPAYRAIAKQLAKRAQAVKTHAKLEVLTELLRQTPDRVVVFSDHRPTIQLIEERVKQLDRKPIVYWGSHSTAERDKRIRAFHDDKRSVLIASRAGSEGRNLQFCNVLVNYDLPWNPMVVEQRIGRLHRIGQKREVHIVNLAAAGTIESYILQLLDRKIKLFELVVGELDLILGEFGGAQQFEGRLAEEWLAAESEADFARRVETIGADIEKSSAAGKEQEQLNSLIAPDDNAMRLERRFETLSVPGRLRLGLGTSQLVKAAGWDAKRHQLGVHVKEVLEALESIEPIGGVTTPQPAGHHPEYGELVRLTGMSSTGRAIALVAQVERLPLVLVDIEADPAA
jgi:SNF2 family DNA or RNA helicase